MGTAGRAVVFAGCTVMISLLGMLLMRLSFLHGLALGTSTAVLIAVLAAVTLLPALLGFVGRGSTACACTAGGADGRTARRWRTAGPAASSAAQSRSPSAGARRAARAGRPGLQHAPGRRRRRQRPAGSTTREAYDLLAEGFGPGSTAR